MMVTGDSIHKNKESEIAVALLIFKYIGNNTL